MRARCSANNAIWLHRSSSSARLSMPPYQPTNTNALYRALVDPMRVRILNLIRHRRELSAADVTSIFGLQRSDLSRHMRFLERAHLITSRRVGLLRQYRFTEELSPFHQRLIDFLSSLEDLPELRQDMTDNH